MKPTIQNVDLLLGLKPLEVARYLKSHGWHEQSQIDEKASLWTFNSDSEQEFEIFLPLNPDSSSFPLHIYEVVQTLELVESRSYFQILGDLVTEAANIQVQGVITHLEKIDDAGIITLIGCAVGKFRKMQLKLTAANYTLAVKAYQERLPVVCTGNLIKKNNVFILKSPRDFTLDESGSN